MSDIKMSDVFDLPLEVLGQVICDQGCGEVLTANFSNTKADPILDYTVIAIHTYSANQERIEKLEAMLQEVIYHFESGNADHSDLNDGMIPKLKELLI